jgi:hypothetical protein
MFLLDLQFQDINRKAIHDSAKWESKKFESCQMKRNETEQFLNSCGFSIEYIEAQWKEQVDVQSRSFPRE